MHQLTNVTVEVDGPTATRPELLHGAAGRPASACTRSSRGSTATGSRCVDGAWRFTERVFDPRLFGDLSGHMRALSARERHPADLLRLGARGVAVFVAGAAIARMHGLSRFEVDAFHLVNDLPDAFRIPFETVMQLGTFAAVVVVVVVALARSGAGGWRWRPRSRASAATSARTSCARSCSAAARSIC